ncbi:hypothetical protein OAJ27_02130, partial [bacterium]|nr:hypothetical protein [bacterium]
MLRIIILLVCDIIAVTAALLTAYSLKFKLHTLLDVFIDNYQKNIYNHAQIEHYVENIFIVIFIWMISLFSMNTY